LNERVKNTILNFLTVFWNCIWIFGFMAKKWFSGTNSFT